MDAARKVCNLARKKSNLYLFLHNILSFLLLSATIGTSICSAIATVKTDDRVTAAAFALSIATTTIQMVIVYFKFEERALKARKLYKRANELLATGDRERIIRELGIIDEELFQVSIPTQN
jgi:uncharacterized membrane protein YbhN (UPF0104 family)